MERLICIHGHFYQPPRENPWLEEIEVQDSAYPYHDWNERINSECYAPNAMSRILDEQGRIISIVNNYSKMSFNFGPTLLAWLEKKAPDVYGAVVQADLESRKRFSGHGSALAQPYNHMILPLANRRDKYTQILWGIEDFKHRFGREPEGMWLPETAVDLETLDILSEQGISFTILAPHQASRVRALSEERWEEVHEGKIDTTRPYLLTLPSRRTISLFFYDGAISRGVAFEGLLTQGESFARRLIEGFSGSSSCAQLVHIATDGESYGHHHRFGDMALAYALHYIETQGLATLTNYGEYLERYPADHAVEIHENTSWSCAHGVERWRGDCGCNSGVHPQWNQGWRRPLRTALDWLRDTLAPAYEERLGKLVQDPWEARNQYIGLILDRSPAQVDRFLKKHSRSPLKEGDRIVVLKLLELQRNAMLMFTSCGWFFDDISGLETVQILQYAGRALQLFQEIFGANLEGTFLELLEQAESNVPESGNGRDIFEKYVGLAKLNLEKVAAHYAMSSLFTDYPEEAQVSCYKVVREFYQSAETGRARFATGKLFVSSEITGESAELCFAILHWGDHNMSGCVRACKGNEPTEAFLNEVSGLFSKADFPGAFRAMETYLGASRYSLKSLFRDEQRRILDLILKSSLADTEGIYRQVYETHAPLVRFLRDSGIPVPKAFSTAAEFVLNMTLQRLFEEENDFELVKNTLSAAHMEGVTLDSESLEMAIRKRLELMAEDLTRHPRDLSLLEKLGAFMDLLALLPFQVNLWKVQNVYYGLGQTAYPKALDEMRRGKKSAELWVKQFRNLGNQLSVRIE